MALIPEPPAGLSPLAQRRFFDARRALAMREDVTLTHVPLNAELLLRPLGGSDAIVVRGESTVEVPAFVLVDADLTALAPSDAAAFIDRLPADTLIALRASGLHDLDVAPLAQQTTLERLSLSAASVTVDGIVDVVEAAALRVLQVHSPNLDDRLVEVVANTGVEMAMLEVTGLGADAIARLIVTSGIDHLVLTEFTPRHARGIRPLQLTSVHRLTLVAKDSLTSADIEGLQLAIEPAVGQLSIQSRIVEAAAA